MVDRPEHQEARPRSPHLQVYRPTLTMTMSIAHRITGAALYLGAVLFVWWLTAISAGRGAYAFEQDFMNSVSGRVILFFFSWSILHHALGGVRHLIWDLGFAHDYPWREYLARATIIGSLSATVLLWIAGVLRKEM